MTQSVTYQVQENIALITLNSPPVNALGLEVRSGILSGFEQAIKDESVQAIIISSSGKLFCGGADVSEFGSSKAFAFPSLPELCNTLEESTKPLIAAVNGMALGGGFELALACDYRIALPQAKLGLPEVSLGLLPGAGGTQRLPRLAGPQLALEMITSGKPFSASVMKESGLIDVMCEGEDLLAAAITYAKELVEQNAPLKSCANMKVNTSELSADFFNDFRNSIARRTRGFKAPEACIQAVETACESPLVEGLKKEAALFKECLMSPQARAQQHMFFAERAASRIPGIDPKTPIRDIKKVAIIGSGTMGGGIAMNYLNAGIPTIILDLNPEALERGIQAVRKNYEISAKRGRITQEQVEGFMALLHSTTQYSELADADLVIEAVFENMDVKKKVFTSLDEVCKEGAILATNTSTLDINEIAAITKRPQDVVGLHFFSPANVMRLMEIVRTDSTSDEVLMTCTKMAKTIRKVAVVSGVCWGFIGNRLLEPYGREAGRMILEGATPEQIDSVLYNFGMAMGVISMYDMAGNDIGYLIRQGNKEACYSRDPIYQLLGDKLYELGRFGQKSGRGYYIYEGRDKKNDPELMELASDLAKEHNVKQRAIGDQEILERTIFMLINEGAQVLADGISYRSSDIDTVYCNGYGFPAHRGGPMQYADEIGLDKVVEALNKYRDQLGAYGEEFFKPAPLLEKLAAEGKKFKDYVVAG